MITIGNQLAVLDMRNTIAFAERRKSERRDAKTYRNRELRVVKRSGNLCMNARKNGLPSRGGVVHGPPITLGGKCAHCVAVHKKSRGKGGGSQSRTAS